jgi:hypothetical protein
MGLVCLLLLASTLWTLSSGAQYNYITTLGGAATFFFCCCGHPPCSLARFADALQGAVRSTTQLDGAAEVSGQLGVGGAAANGSRKWFRDPRTML